MAAQNAALSAAETAGPNRRATFAVIVENQPGVLHRVVGLFAARGYNIETLTVSETDHTAHTSHIFVSTRGAPPVLAQIRAQLKKLVCVHAVIDIDIDIDRDAERG